ncbi:hypothetical protein MANES_11G134050v8 [Manihot esculenta]|uniref:Uncharacterized protein n=1 Tax=Manihot esculenta TaxID=3983 RepID=A0ACB7GVV0_MANES|nr:hypothetical protein MANES_11G134050v8 [Manihot esculenta]
MKQRHQQRQKPRPADHEAPQPHDRHHQQEHQILCCQLMPDQQTTSDISDDHAGEWISSLDYSRLTSFLEFDDSFLSPWNWNSDFLFVENGEKQRMMFLQGSFFSHYSYN